MSGAPVWTGTKLITWRWLSFHGTSDGVRAREVLVVYKEKILRFFSGVRYFMNLDRCAWNGKHESYDYSTFVCGKSVLGVYRNCTNVYEYKRNGEWREYNRTAIKDLRCILPWEGLGYMIPNQNTSVGVEVWCTYLTAVALSTVVCTSLLDLFLL